MADPAKIELLKKQRAAFKGQLTSFKNQLSSLSSIGGVEALLHRIQSINVKYDGVQSKLESLDDGFVADRTSFDDDYLSFETILRDKIHEFKRLDDGPTSASFHNASIHELTSNTSPSVGMRLPEITLPSFNGMETDWLAFRDVFVDLIHVKNLDPIVKFLYLISSIRTGTAYSYVESLPVTAANYELAWAALRDHYDNEISIQRLHTRELYDIRTPHENSPKALQYFVDKAVKHVSALKSLNVRVSEWDLLLVHHLTQRLDSSSRLAIIKGMKPKTILSFSDLIDLLRSRVRVLSAITANVPQGSSRPLRSHKSMSFNTTSVANPTACNTECLYCSGDHTLPHCPSFSSERMSPRSRFYFIRDRRLCGNCLIERHLASNCNRPACNKCSLKHHTLLHFPQDSSPTNNTRVERSPNLSLVHKCDNIETNAAEPLVETNCSANVTPSSRVSTSSEGYKDVILIGTALVHASVNNGFRVLCRALLDSGSTLNFVSEAACQLLQARRYTTAKVVSGIGAVDTTIKHKIYLTISSRTSDFSANLKFYVLPKITNDLPSSRISVPSHALPKGVVLADPFFNIPDRVDLLLGVEIYHQLFKGSSVRVHDWPLLYDSELGFVICGKTKTKLSINRSPQSHVALCSVQTLENQVKQFWELETITSKPILSQEEIAAEEHYKSNVSRTPEGRYIVGLPTKSNLALLGSSYASAHRQFLSLESRLLGQQEIYKEYQEFLNEYRRLGHMTPVCELKGHPAYYLPHHGVIKEQSSTTKLRVVFNASARTSTHISLNDCLMVGPTIQSDLVSTLLRFRNHIIAFSGDIAKMYRQILVQRDQQSLQRILWRNHASEPIQTFNLNTVTYGTACAPFLATRTLKQLACDEESRFPTAAHVLKNDFYVDDVLTGAVNINDAIKLKNDLIELLHLGGFELRKFVSNAKQLASDDATVSSITLVLGLMWNTESDTFEMLFNKLPATLATTKRTLLSEICQLFDPLGFCAPVIVTAKLTMQTIWMHQNLSWDDHLPDTIIHHWHKFKNELSALSIITVPRLITSNQEASIELHGFCDASERAYGCVCYTRSVAQTNQFHVTLLCSKSRVAPLKKETIPRLELCAAVLLAEVVHKIIHVMGMKFNAIYLWTDSQITLFRINSEPYKYTTFVANRLTRIHELTSISDWFYVPTLENPADIVSRGLMPSQFLSASLWWNGPVFLTVASSTWSTTSNQTFSQDSIGLELRKAPIPVLTQSPVEEHFIFHRFSCFNRLVRVVAYICRLANNARRKNDSVSTTTLQLQPLEIQMATALLIRLVQHQAFAEDINALNNSHQVPLKSKLIALTPLLDDKGILRVGGRILQASTTENHKHPILLPAHHSFTTLLVRREHTRLLHAGPQALLYSLRQTYWIVGGRNVCRRVVHECVRCFRVKPLIHSQIMGDLPLDRITKTSRAFTVVGIDFCGPFYSIQSLRSKIKHRCYICLFVCFTTKAVHLEVVTNLSTDAFLACLKRFVARRGLCTKIYSDNATNFIGARNELREIKTLFTSQPFQESICQFTESHNIEWITIPPRSPHFGGLWESAIKGAKHHLRRVVGTSGFTLEELFTLTTQIEACLNSRPLTPLSSDPNDLSALSPGHFIIGAPLTALPEPSLLDLNVNRLSRFQKLQQMIQHFWKRWHREYLSELQHRYKWQQGTVLIQVGSMVVLHDENLPPLNWLLGRVTDVHPGKDGIIRVVTVKTMHSELKRAVNRVSILPIETGAKD